jgi:glycine/D-amino acid oxidase-like deaminating enzyme
MSDRCDILIVGGGIVGLATAMALSRRTRAAITLIEAEHRLAAHQTGNNSGVLNAPSPAATASISIGAHVAETALRRFGSR